MGPTLTLPSRWLRATASLKYFAIFAGIMPLGCIDPGLLGMNEQAAEQDTADDETPESEDPDYPDAEDGTCSAWKFAYCDAIDACSAFDTREQCELDLGWLVCLPDAPLQSCQEKIEKAVKDKACDDLPQDCNPAEIADRSLPYQLCLDIHTSLCEYRLYCGLELSLDGCVETLNRTEPCDSFTSFLPTAVDCAEAFTTLACGDPLPEVCVGSLRR